MQNSDAIAEVLETRLRLYVKTADIEWQAWEHKTLNIHRGVLYWRPGNPGLSFVEMTERIRERVAAEYRVSWWRGFGFGVVIESKMVPPDLSTIMDTIDARVSAKGTWQWTILACEPFQMGIGVHTWTSGYLTPVYREILAHFEAQGCMVGSFKKEKDQLMQFLTTVARSRGGQFQEFDP